MTRGGDQDAGRRRRATVPRRRGTVLLFFAMILVVVLGTLAVVVELGFVRADQRRMQSAAATTAREVLRDRDLVLGPGDEDAAARDLGRRERNRLFASWTFAPELDTTYEPAPQGAGAWIEMLPGEGSSNVGARVVGTGHGVPVLETNFAEGGAAINAQHGDIVSGRFTGHTRTVPNAYQFDPAHYVGTDGSPLHLEDGTYARVDFEPAAPAQSAGGSAVAVRLRRTVPQGWAPLNALDVQDDVSSSGWTLPLTFGAGSPFQAADPEQGYSLRHHGLPLRATAVATARPALRAGLPHAELGEEWGLGVGPITIWDEAWRLDVPGWWQTGPNGEEYIILRIGDTDLSLRNQLSDATIFGFISIPREQRVGNEVTPIDAPQSELIDVYADRTFWENSESLAPSLYQINVEGVGNRYFVAGFYRIKTELYVDGDGNPILLGTEYPIREQVKLTRLPNELAPGAPYVAPRNVSARLDGEQQVDLPAGVWGNILKSLERAPNLVQAPVIVR